MSGEESREGTGERDDRPREDSVGGREENEELNVEDWRLLMGKGLGRMGCRPRCFGGGDFTSTLLRADSVERSTISSKSSSLAFDTASEYASAGSRFRFNIEEIRLVGSFCRTQREQTQLSVHWGHSNVVKGSKGIGYLSTKPVSVAPDRVNDERTWRDMDHSRLLRLCNSP